MKILTCKVLLALAFLGGVLAGRAPAQTLNLTSMPTFIGHEWNPASWPLFPPPYAFGVPALIDTTANYDGEVGGFSVGSTTNISVTWSAPPGEMFVINPPPAALGPLNLRLGASFGFYGPNPPSVDISFSGASFNLVSGTAPVNHAGVSQLGLSPLVLDFNMQASIATNGGSFAFTSATITAQLSVSTNADFGPNSNYEPYSIILYGANSGDSTDPGQLLTLQPLPNSYLNPSNYNIGWFKVAGGGGTSTGGGYTVSGTFGQQDAGGSLNGSGYSVTLGFWSLLGQAAPALIPTVPVITSQPQSQFVNVGSPATFTVSVTGTPPLYYQWQKNGVNLTDGGNLSGSTNANLILSTTSTNDAGGYSVVIQNAYGNVTNSSVAKLTLVLPAYYATDLGTLGGSESSAQGINNTGQVVGNALTSGNAAAHAFLYSGGTMQDLGTLGGNNSYALGINNNGQVVGYSYETGNTDIDSFLYSGGSMSGLLPDDGNTQANGINDSGQIAGSCSWYYGSTFGGYSYLGYYAYLDTGGAFTDLGTFGGVGISTAGGSSVANDINNNGQIVGYANGTTGSSHAFLYSGGTMTDLGTLGGTFSGANGINNSGQVVGYSDTAGNTADHAFLYSGGGPMQDLGTLGGTFSGANGINNGGQVVGYAGTAANAAEHAFLSSGGTMFDLNNLVNTNALGTSLNASHGINDSGQIIANGNNSHAYLLTPSLPASFLTGNFPPQFETTSVAAGNFHLGWNAVNTWPPVGYQVQYTTNLATPNWINLGGVLTGSTATDTIATNRQRFYRVLLVQ